MPLNNYIFNCCSYCISGNKKCICGLHVHATCANIPTFLPRIARVTCVKIDK